MPKPHDKWCEISSEAEAIEVGEEIAKILEESGIPPFATISSTERLKRLWGTGGSLGLTEYQPQPFLKALNGERSQ